MQFANYLIIIDAKSVRHQHERFLRQKQHPIELFNSTDIPLMCSMQFAKSCEAIKNETMFNWIGSGSARFFIRDNHYLHRNVICKYAHLSRKLYPFNGHKIS